MCEASLKLCCLAASFACPPFLATGAGSSSHASALLPPHRCETRREPCKLLWLQGYGPLPNNNHRGCVTGTSLYMGYPASVIRTPFHHFNAMVRPSATYVITLGRRLRMWCGRHGTVARRLPNRGCGDVRQRLRSRWPGSLLRMPLRASYDNAFLPPRRHWHSSSGSYIITVSAITILQGAQTRRLYFVTPITFIFTINSQFYYNISANSCFTNNTPCLLYLTE